ncbi:c-type cytochrome [Shewanella sp. Scap07]|uniref:c-type cytochrome n=1 Tax=Shewanella sp. Scap07 TaxID=2589987 RepID=UPI0015BFDC04|nr:c-type cytochrome [Shewanella sp. Scap07]QLE84546.1 c-type cytochrome [Shewanella sp. Scap07]
MSAWNASAIPPRKSWLLLLLLPLGIGHANDQPEPQLLNMCKACHGEQGLSQFATIPNLQGQSAQYLIEQLKQFKSAQRQDPTMTKVAKLLNEQQINAIAHYFANTEDESK